MGFWGMSDAGKRAQDAMRGQVQNNTDNSRWWQANASQNVDNGNALWQQTNDYWGNRGGAPSPESITATGNAIAPWQAAFGRMQGNQQNTRDQWGRTIRGTDVQPNIMANLGMAMDNINNNREAIQGEIDRGYSSASGREGDTTGEIRGNIGTAYDTAGREISGAYGDARKNNASAYADIIGRIGNAYSDMKTEARRIMPGGELQQAATARAFAPNMASAAGRLRRAGVDPNGVQAANVLGNVETARARAMDDRAASSASDYVRTMNGIREGQVGAETGAIRERTGNDINLGTTAAGLQSNLALGRGRDTNTEAARYLAAMNGLDLGRMRDTASNLDATAMRQNSNLADRSQLDILNRNMANEDLRTEAGLNTDANNLEMTGLNLQDNAFNRGMNFTQYDRQQLDDAQRARMQLMQQAFQNAQSSGGQAFNNGQAALQGNQNIYQQEAANAGWGTRLLGGIAGSALGGWLGGAGGITGLIGGGAGRAATTPPFVNVSGNAWNNPSAPSSLFTPWRP
jgi:hypothetical protein